MLLSANKDIYGRPENLTSSELRHILDLTDKYMDDVPYTIHEIRKDDTKDVNGRIDIEVRFVNKENHLVQQKLLILNDELIDGNTFHERYHEWY